MSTKIFSVSSDKVQAIVRMGIDMDLDQSVVLSQVIKQHSGFLSAKLYDDSIKDVSLLVYADLVDAGTSTDILIAKYVKSDEYANWITAWRALDAARTSLVATIDPDSGIGVRSMPDPDLFVSSPGGGGRRAYDYVVGKVYSSPTCPEWGVEVIETVPVMGKDKAPMMDAKTNKPVLFVNRCRVVAIKDGTPKPRSKEFSSLSSAVAYIQKRWAQSPATTTPGKDGDPLTTGLNCPKWLGIDYA